MEGEILSVSQLREYVNQTLSYAYPAIVVEGEVSSFKVNQGKWIFFDLKDAETTVGCFMTKYQLNTVLEDGMLVRVTAVPNLTKWGKFSLTVRSVELAGAGTVKQAFEKLKAQFEAEGLFASARKRALPEYPERIGLVTSAEAAAYNDFITIAGERWPIMEIVHTHVQVQGEAAVESVVGAIQYLNQNHPDLQALVVIRGGGSAEDLQTFNTEPVVRALYASKIPTIVGIGHEDDVSLAELVADVRAATPTDAARRLTADRVAVEQQLGHTIDRQERSLQRRLDQVRQGLNRVAGVFGAIDRLAQERLQTATQHFATAARERLEAWRRGVETARRTLHGANPTRILGRGYAIARLGDTILTDPGAVPAGSQIMVQLRQGVLAAQTGEPGAGAVEPAVRPATTPPRPQKSRKEPSHESQDGPQISFEF